MPLTTSAVQVSHTAATLLMAAQSGSAGGVGTHKGVTIQNLGPNAIWVGDSTVSATTGIKVSASGGVYILTEETVGPVYGIADSADQVSPLDTRVGLESGVGQ